MGFATTKCLSDKTLLTICSEYLPMNITQSYFAMVLLPLRLEENFPKFRNFRWEIFSKFSSIPRVQQFTKCLSDKFFLHFSNLTFHKIVLHNDINKKSNKKLDNESLLLIES